MKTLHCFSSPVLQFTSIIVPFHAVTRTTHTANGGFKELLLHAQYCLWHYGDRVEQDLHDPCPQGASVLLGNKEVNTQTYYLPIVMGEITGHV